MYNIEIIFVPDVSAKLKSQGVKVEENGAVTFHNVHDFEQETYGLCINFDNNGTVYTYPWHQIARTKIMEIK